jgi:DHA1 family bicyclomycin/chloramphenicol resistance-like MFS transporter
MARERLSRPEFVTLLALMTSIVALATDIMLPALDRIGQDLGVADPNDPQLVISSLFVGFAVGQILAGPLSDAYGRRPIILAGYIVFLLGCVMSLTTESFEVMLAGRVLQGLGAAGPRIVAVALVRDGYEGRAMAQILSVIMAVFIIVPAVSPAIGQVIILGAGWRATFAFLFAVAVLTLFWFLSRQPETLKAEDRRAFSAGVIWSGITEAARYRVTLGATLAMGCVFGPFLGYLSSAQQIFQQTYGTGEWFAAWFASAALCIGVASVVNASLVMRLGMRLLIRRSMLAVAVGSLLFLIPTLMMDGKPPFWAFLMWLAPVFFCMGLNFGNMNALAMEPLGHMAGLGAALIGSASTILSLPVGWFIGNQFDGGITPLIAGFGILGALSLFALRLCGPTQSVA